VVGRRRNGGNRPLEKSCPCGLICACDDDQNIHDKTDSELQRYTVARLRIHCCHSNATVRFLLIVVGVDVTVVPQKCNSGFHFRCYRATKYFVLLLTTVSIEYYECVGLFVP
jgi:hypothetical protein